MRPGGLAGDGGGTGGDAVLQGGGGGAVMGHGHAGRVTLPGGGREPTAQRHLLVPPGVPAVAEGVRRRLPRRVR